MTDYILNAVEKFARCVENVITSEQVIVKDNRRIPTFQELWKHDKFCIYR